MASVSHISTQARPGGQETRVAIARLTKEARTSDKPHRPHEPREPPGPFPVRGRALRRPLVDRGSVRCRPAGARPRGCPRGRQRRLRRLRTLRTVHRVHVLRRLVGACSVAPLSRLQRLHGMHTLRPLPRLPCVPALRRLRALRQQRLSRPMHRMQRVHVRVRLRRIVEAGLLHPERAIRPRDVLCSGLTTCA